MEYFKIKPKYKKNILIVDDEIINREIIGNFLQSKYEITYASNGNEALELLDNKKNKFSLILLDLFMPVMDGFELLEIMNESGLVKSIPVIVMTADKSAETKCIKLGSIDFITKPFDLPEVIIARCDRIIEFFEGKNLINIVEKDSLTGLYTKDFFFEYIRQINTLTSSEPMDAVFINIDHFHLINELYGREKGDLALKNLGEKLLAIANNSLGIGCRIESDNFYYYCKHQKDYSDMLKELQASFECCDNHHKITLRIGVCSNITPDEEIELFFDRAKSACDSIKNDYTKHISYFNNELKEASIFNARLIDDLDDAILNNDLIVYYQPKYGILSDVPILKSAEALIRWNHPEFGMISPGKFIPLFESNGLIQKLDQYVWEQAAKQIKYWKEKYNITIPISVNVSRVDIYDSTLEKRLNQILLENELSASDLMLEITESAYAENAAILVNVVNKLRNDGFKIEMDDFGSGYSSLNMLTSLPIDILKIDMIFIRNMMNDAKSLKMLELVLDIAKFLHVPVVAEGVETKEQFTILKDRGCDIIQGYYFSKPVPPEEFAPFIEAML
ncbi:MAG: EAL domain-containing protein [Lachnospiraceae bacterium]|nr:EAL domain-containing protein [Lachnospiraceae bacterium]